MSETDHGPNGDQAPGNGKKGRPFGPAMSFVLDYLRMSPEATNKEILARAQLEKLKLSPNTLSLARKRLGLGMGQRKGKASRKSQPAVATAPAREPVRAQHRAGARPAPLAQLEQLVQALRDDEQRIEHLEEAIRATIRVLQAALDAR